MKNWIYNCVLIFALISCNKEKEVDYNKYNIKAVVTGAVSNINQNSAQVEGILETDNGSSIIEMGVTYSIQPNISKVTQKETYIPAKSGARYTVTLKNLEPNTKYFLRAYATNSLGTAFGEEKEFTTQKAILAQIRTIDTLSVSRNSAVIRSVIENDGGYQVTRRGVVYSTTSQAPDINTSQVTDNGQGSGVYQTEIKDLKPAKRYYVRAFAVTKVGAAYGEMISFTTKAPTVPSGVEINQISNITNSSAILESMYLSDGGSLVQAKGIVYSNSNTNPTLENSMYKISNSDNFNNFTTHLSELTPNTVYYVRAVVRNSIGISYSSVKEFKTTGPDLPSQFTISVSDIDFQKATFNGSVNNDGRGTISFRGFVYSSQNSMPTLVNASQISAGTGKGSFSSRVENLQPNTTYYVRAVATNEGGTSYSEVYSFRTQTQTAPANISISLINFITNKSAYVSVVFGGDGGSPISGKGIVYSTTNTAPIIGTGTQAVSTYEKDNEFSVNLENLLPNTTYYVRAYVKNGIGTAYSHMKEFRTLSANLPSSLSLDVSNLGLTSATLTGSVINDGNSPITWRGFVLSTTTNTPTRENATIYAAGTGTGNFSMSISGLQPNTTYYVRSAATNAQGTAYSSTQTFKTSAAAAPSGLSVSVSSIKTNGATFQGYIASDGGVPVTWRGFVLSSTTSTPTIANSPQYNAGSGTGSFSLSVSDLQPNTTYYVRAVATNAGGTSYSSTTSFKTPAATVSLKVGDSYQGGKIAYIFKVGDQGYVAGEIHGLIVGEMQASKSWGCWSMALQTNGDGRYNTLLIQEKCTWSDAANSFKSLTILGYSDWYWPSVSELVLIAQNLSYIGLKSFTVWSSNAAGSNSHAAVVSVNSSGVHTVYNEHRASSFSLLPVRSF